MEVPQWLTGRARRWGCCREPKLSPLTRLSFYLLCILLIVSKFHGNKDVVLKITDLDSDASGSSMRPECFARILVLLLAVQL